MPEKPTKSTKKRTQAWDSDEEDDWGFFDFARPLVTVCMHAYVCMHVCVFMLYVCMCVCVCVCMYVYIGIEMMKRMTWEFF